MAVDNRLPCFIAMPFAQNFLPVYRDVIKPLFEDPDFDDEYICLRADEVSEPGRITEQIISMIHECAFIIADITGSNPNVMYEIGYAHALERPTLIINQDPTSSPFDVKDYRQISYQMSEDGLRLLKLQLRRTLQDIMSTFSSWHIRRLQFGSLEEQISSVRWLGDNGSMDGVEALLQIFDLPISSLREEIEKAFLKLGKRPEFMMKITNHMITYLSEDDKKNMIRTIVDMDPEKFEHYDFSDLDEWKERK